MVTLIIPFKSILKAISITGIPVNDTLLNSISPINVFLFAIFLSPWYIFILIFDSPGVSVVYFWERLAGKGVFFGTIIEKLPSTVSIPKDNGKTSTNKTFFSDL